MKISNAALAQEGRGLLAQAQERTIPYVRGGMSLAGMDCQGMVEHLLIQCGVPGSECNLAGSNAHWRALKWSGTPEEAVKLFGGVPEGAALFIWQEEGEPSKYAGDGMGNADHMGLYLGGNSAIHASASRECVAESVFRQKTIPNGGWNRVGLLPWVDYGWAVEAALDGLYGGPLDVREPERSEAMAGGADAATQAEKFPDVRYFAQVVTPNGKPANMRAEPSKACDLYKEVPNGEIVLVIGTVAQGGRTWCRVERGSRKWYIMADYLRKV